MAKAGISIADIATGMYAYSGVLTALYDRERTGEGASLHVAMLDSLGEWMSQPAYFSRYGQEPPRRTAAAHPSISPYGPYRTGDDHVFLSVQSEREWIVLCRDVLARPELAEDPRFGTNDDRVRNDGDLTTILEETFGGLTADEVGDLLERSGIANARLRTPEQFTRHPQLTARNRWREVETPAGTLEALLPPVEVVGHEPVMGPVPALGAHNESIRAEFDARQEVRT